MQIYFNQLIFSNDLDFCLIHILKIQFIQLEMINYLMPDRNYYFEIIFSSNAYKQFYRFMQSLVGSRLSEYFWVQFFRSIMPSLNHLISVRSIRGQGFWIEFRFCIQSASSDFLVPDYRIFFKILKLEFSNKKSVLTWS